MMANTVSRYLYGLTVNIILYSGRYIAHYYTKGTEGYLILWIPLAKVSYVSYLEFYYDSTVICL